MDILSISEASCFRACPRKHHYRYVKLRRPVKQADSLALGSYVHQGLEILLKQGEVALISWMKAHELTYDIAKAQAMLAFYAALPRPFEVLEVEREFQMPLINPVSGRPATSRRLGGKYDGLVRRDGKLYVLEHKTTSEDITPGSDFWVRLRMAAQPSLYLSAARLARLEHPEDPTTVDGVLYNVIRKPRLRPLKANKRRSVDETPDEYRARCAAAMANDPAAYQRYGDVVRTQEEMYEANLDLWLTHKMMQLTTKTETAPPRNSGACNDYHRLCAYFDVCTGCGRLEDDAVFYSAPRKHEELVQCSTK